MGRYVVVETDDGLVVVEVLGHDTPEGAAEKERGILVDPTTYATFEDAYDALLLSQEEDEHQLR